MTRGQRPGNCKTEPEVHSPFFSLKTYVSKKHKKTNTSGNIQGVEGSESQFRDKRSYQLTGRSQNDVLTKGPAVQREKWR